MILSEVAGHDLEEIWFYTYLNWSKDQADRYHELLLSKCRYVSEYFDKGKEADHILFGYRSYQVKSHIIFFKKNENNIVEIIRILHQQVDFKSKF